MWSQLRGAAGYLWIFIVPSLLVVGIAMDEPALAFGFVMLALPLLRPVFGAVRTDAIVWHECVATSLDRLPLLYAGLLPLIIAALLHHVSSYGVGPLEHAVGLGLSLWMTLLLSTCVSHELIHRKSAQAHGGHCLAGLAGYPLLAQEHLAHHARPGDTASAAWPRIDESVWRFAFRRSLLIVSQAYAPGSDIWSSRARGRRVFGLRLSTATTASTAIAFAWTGGWPAFVLYLCVAIGVCFGMQLITYIQHWGLGDDHLGPKKASVGCGWEDDCRLQAWATLNISLHHGHHQRSQLPFYRARLSPNSPRLPSGYIVLMVLCLFPPLWFRLMRPALDHWLREPAHPRSAGRRLTCFSLYGSDSAAAVNR
ncbi:MAG: hypothetical protein EOO27_11530 [Comamonadaceae bacterium]|nr:MAG: hypothetical protein EOO27_11530 [Comamonadaceae bacterium]